MIRLRRFRNTLRIWLPTGVRCKLRPGYVVGAEAGGPGGFGPRDLDQRHLDQRKL
jgi:hypothetical protein